MTKVAIGFDLEPRAVPIDKLLPSAVEEKDLKEYFDTNYGIFRGKATKIAKLRFTPERARWVANEVWHPQQKGRFDADGGYLLEVPYHDGRELVMDVLRHGADVEVMGPAELQRAVLAQARAVAAKLGAKGTSQS